MTQLSSMLLKAYQQPPKLLYVAFLILILQLDSFPLFAQGQVKITGTVSNANKEALIGVSVSEKGTQNGTLTDENGHYSLSVTAGAVIEFSYIGYIAEEHKAINGVLDITLKENTQSMDELVVIGYGFQKKSNVTGAISSIKASDLADRSVTDVGAALQGKVSGLQVVNTSGSPGANATLRIRGFSSNGISDPLYIVDGLKVPDLSSIDMENIESMEILKDGASAAIYGAEAGNGVVLITTKTGKKGAGKISINGQNSFSRLAKKMRLMDAPAYLNYMVESGLRTQGVIDEFYFNDPASYINEKPANTDWQKAAFENGYRQRYTIDFQGGSDKGAIYTSLGYLNHDGIITGNKDAFQRISGQINTSFQLKEWIKIGTTNAVEVSKLKSVSESNVFQNAIISQIYIADPLTPVEYSDGIRGIPQTVKDGIAQGYAPLIDAKTGNYYGTPYWAGLNPMALIARDDKYTDVSQLNGTAFANLTPLKNFVFTSRLGYRLSKSYGYDYNPPYWMNPNTFLSKNPSLEAEQFGTNYYQIENFANYLLPVDKHDFTLLAGMSYTNSVVNRTYVRTNSLSNLNDNFHYLDYSTKNANYDVEGNTLRRRQVAYYGRFGWDYDSRYNIQVNFRADAYDASYLDPNHSWGYFPSVSAGWTLSNEKFMENINKGILSFAKVRASYGKNGSISNLGGYMYASVLNTGNQYYMNNELITGTFPSDFLANPRLRWEESVQTNVGLDLRLINNKASLTIDYFNKNTTGLLVQSVAPLVTGTSFIWQNVGKINNRGLEIEAEWKDNIGSKFSYGIRGNISPIKNEVTKYRGEGTRLGGASLAHSRLQLTYLEEGFPLWYLRGFQMTGINENDGSPIYRDIDGNGEITDNDRVNIGSGIPKFTYGGSIYLKYGGFDLNIFGAGASGNKLMWGVLNATLTDPENKPMELYEGRWVPGKKDAIYPSAVYFRSDNFANSDAMVFDASYFKIKQIQLGYTLPASILKKSHLAGLRVYASMDDFFTFTKYPGLDPETRPDAASGMAIDYGGYPIAKTILIGLNLTF